MPLASRAILVDAEWAPYAAHGAKRYQLRYSALLTSLMRGSAASISPR